MSDDNLTCPECRQDKHQNCTGQAWDQAADAPVPCRCDCPQAQAERIEVAQQRYLAACHAIQSGVMYEHSRGSQDGTPKHLRVGVNTAHTSIAALTKLLLDRGVFTHAEYAEAQAEAAENEVAAYESRNHPMKFR